MYFHEIFFKPIIWKKLFTVEEIDDDDAESAQTLQIPLELLIG